MQALENSQIYCLHQKKFTSNAPPFEIKRIRKHGISECFMCKCSECGYKKSKILSRLQKQSLSGGSLLADPELEQINDLAD